MNNKNRLKSGLRFGIAMAVFFTLQNILKQDSLTTKTIFTSIIVGLFSGAISGLLFGWIMGLFLTSKFVSQTTKIATAADETILFETGANHFKGTEGVGGKLYLTDKRLVFKSHNFNIQNHELSIPLADIDKVDRYKTVGLVNNGLTVTTTDGTIEKFVVQQPQQWLHQLAGKNGLQQLHLQ